MKVLAGSFNQEKALRGLLRDRENFADGSFAALVCMLGTAAVAEEDDNKQCDPRPRAPHCTNIIINVPPLNCEH